MKIPKNKSIKGLFVYCNYCKSVVLNKCKQTNGSIDFCPHSEKHVFKAIFSIPGTKKTKTRILDTRDINEAIVQTLEYEEYLKENYFELQYSGEKIKKPQLLVDCMGMYLDYLNNVNIPPHRQKVRSKNHLKDVERFLRYFIDCLNKNKIVFNSLFVHEIDDNILGLFHTYLVPERKLSINWFTMN